MEDPNDERLGADGAAPILSYCRAGKDGWGIIYN